MRPLVTHVAIQAAAVGLVVAVAAPALAAGADRDAAGARSRVTGNDISFPQCGAIFPARPAFGIVGVNGGLANDLNPCLGPSASHPSYRRAELYWAVAAATGVASQPKASLYVDTGDPGNLYKGRPIADWPKAGLTPYGACATTRVRTRRGTFTVGRNSSACAWRYGFMKAAQDVSWVAAAAKAIDRQKPPVTVAAAASRYPWWLDVELSSSWRTGTSGHAMNVADLQGMIAALRCLDDWGLFHLIPVDHDHRGHQVVVGLALPAPQLDPWCHNPVGRQGRLPPGIVYRRPGRSHTVARKPRR
jgi:hypothetical protein